MRRRLLMPIVGVGVVAAVSLSAAPPSVLIQAPEQDRPVSFRASAEAVSVDVAVRRSGRPVGGLAASDFEILDNGVPQTIVDFSDGGRPIDVRVAFDVSASVTPRLLTELRDAMRLVQSSLQPNDRLQILTFSSRIRRIIDAGRGSDFSDVFDRIQTSGSTAVFDALAVALATPVLPDRRYLVVAFTDGLDTGSITQPAALLDLARRTTPTLFVVLPAEVTYAIGEFSPPSAEEFREPGQPRSFNQRFEPQRIDFGPAVLAFRQIYAELARETGGLAVAIRPDGDLPGGFHQALQEFRDSYVLHFVPTGVERSGAHELSVRVQREGVEVRARRQYVRK